MEMAQINRHKIIVRWLILTIDRRFYSKTIPLYSLYFDRTPRLETSNETVLIRFLTKFDGLVPVNTEQIHHYKRSQFLRQFVKSSVILKTIDINASRCTAPGCPTAAARDAHHAWPGVRGSIFLARMGVLKNHLVHIPSAKEAGFTSETSAVSENFERLSGLFLEPERYFFVIARNHISA